MAGCLKTYKRAVVYVFTSRYVYLKSVLEEAKNEFAEKALTAGLISFPVMRAAVRCSHDQYSKYFSDITNDLIIGLELMKSVEDILKHCQKFTQILEDIGGPVAIVGRELDVKLSTLSDLLNLLTPYGLHYEEMDKECDDSLLIQVSQHLQLIDYIEVGHCLNLSSKTLESIIQHKEDDIERKVAMLWEWKAKNGSAATSVELLNAFLKIEDRIVAESILRYISDEIEPVPQTREVHLAPEKAKDRYPNWDVFTECEKEAARNKLTNENCDVRKAYVIFVTQLLQSFTKREVHPGAIQTVVQCYGIQHQPVVFDFSKDYDVARVFAVLSRHCSWFNYEAFQILVDILGNEAEKKYLTTYENDHLIPYLKRSIFEIPCSSQSQSQRTNLHFQVPTDLCITGNEVKVVQRNLAKLLGLKDGYILHFEDYNIGSIELIFSLPTVVLNESSPKSQLFTFIEWNKSKQCYKVNADLVTVLCYSDKAETSILIKLMKEKEVDLKKATSLLELSEKTKQKDEEVKSQLTDSLNDYKRELALKDQKIFELESILKETKGISILPQIKDTIREPMISSEISSHEQMDTQPLLPKEQSKIEEIKSFDESHPIQSVTTTMDSEQQQDQSLTDTLSEKMKLLDKINRAKTFEIEKLTKVKEAPDNVLVEKQEEIKKLTKEKETTDKLLVEIQKQIEILQEKITLTLQQREREATDKLLVEIQKQIKILQEKITTLTSKQREKEKKDGNGDGKVKDDSISSYNKVSNARNLPPGSYDLMIIGSYGEVSKSQAITAAQKLIPPHLKGSDQWMTDEIGDIEKKHDKATNCDRIVSYFDHVGAQDSKSCYLERIRIFLQECKKRNQDKAIIFYTGNGEKNTGNWCFKDGVITFQEIYGIYMAQFQGKQLTINCDCSYSGNWIKDCAKQLDNLKIPSCGHHTRSRKILLNVWSSCDMDQEATALCYVTEAIKNDERKKVVTDFHTVLSSGQKTRLGDFRQLNCGNANDQKCGLDDISTITWEDRMFHKPELVQLVKKWYYVLIDEDKLEDFKAEAGGTQMFKVTSYGKILYQGFGEKPPEEVNHQLALDLNLCTTIDPEY